jgi:lipopolysaccharide/colanic/teichoic acid biosynthesis glycosyltransferase
VNGRNSLTWEQKFEDDVTYIENITFFGDIKIIFKTAVAVLKREGISQENNVTMEEFKGTREERIDA